MGELSMLILFDLQENLKEIKEGHFRENTYLSQYGTSPAAIDVISTGGTKTIRVRGNVDKKPGFFLHTPALPNLSPGDRITVTGRLGAGVPKSDWAMVIDRNTSDHGYVGLAQHVNPEHHELFSITYLLDTDDLQNSLLIRANQWGKAEKPMDYYVDCILITRKTASANTVTDSRQTVYSLAKDPNVKELKPGDITKFIRSAGTPTYTITEKEGKKIIHLRRRLNNWDGIDVWLPSMELKQGNRYKITVKGKIDEYTQKNAKMMLQTLPGYIWRSEQAVTDDQDFTLTHTFSAMDIQTAEAVRIASDDNGASMSFTIFDIELTARD
jgi:hypothetical protein